MDVAHTTVTLQRALAIFRELIELPECERVAWFEARCGKDAELRTTVERLLAADSEAAGPLDDRAALFNASASTTPSERFANTEVVSGPREDNEARLGQHVGAYRLVRLLGHGGMGAVYLAERNAGGFTQQVALKLIRSGYEGSDARRRFERERQILSRLQHPAIARLYDGGVLEDGSPWFAMELIEGETLSQWCARWALPVRERAALLLRISEAVQYAHQQLVIHRDLKPSNILIDRDGAPHVLDFGIAALLDEQTADDTSPHTFIHTPEYAAPEQIRGDPHSAATDVFTLGVILCELLVGARPFQLANATPFKMQRAVLEVEAPPLHGLLPTDPGVLAGLAAQRGASAAQLRRQLAGDLDLIVHKALEKRPQDRYPSVAAMGEDLRRYLDGRALLAVPPRFSYRAGKFLRRHRAPIAAASAIFAVLIVATVVSLAQARAARQQAERAEAVKQFIVSLFQEAGPGAIEGEPVTAKSLLDGGSSRIAEELGDQPRTAGELFNAIGNAYLYLGDYAAARKQLDAALAKLPAQGDTLRPRFDVLVDLVDMASHQDDVPNGTRWAKEALELRDRIRAHERGWRRWLSATPTLRNYFGDAAQDITSRAEDLDLARARLLDQGDSNKPGLELRRVVAEARMARKGEHETRVRTALNDYALALSDSGDYQGAARMLRQVIADNERRYGPGHASALKPRHNLAIALRNLDQLAEAEVIARENFAIGQRVLPPQHPLNAYIANTIAGILRQQQRYREAPAWYARARHVFDGQPEADPSMLATVYLNEAINAMSLMDNAAAAASLDAADRVWRKAGGPNYQRRIEVEMRGAQLALSRGDIDIAAATLDRLLAEERAKLEPDSRSELRLIGFRAESYLLTGHPGEARQILERAWTKAEQTYTAPHVELIALLRLRAEAALANGDIANAARLIERASKQFAQRSIDAKHSPEIELMRARIAWAEGDIRACTAAALRAEQGFRDQMGDSAWPVLAARAWSTAATLRKSPHNEPARRAHLQAVAALQAVRPFDPQLVELGKAAEGT